MDFEVGYILLDLNVYIKQNTGKSICIIFFTFCGLNPHVREIHQHLYLSLMLSILSSLPLSFHWPWLTKKTRAHPPFRVSLWVYLGIIVVLIYPENQANPFFHLDVPELMPKLLRHSGSAAPWLSTVTFFFFHSHTRLCLNCFVHSDFEGLQLTLNN